MLIMGLSIKKYLLLVVNGLLLFSCTFGSVGNSQEEEALILQNLLRVGREIPSSLDVNLLSYDTQSDDNLNQFNILSNLPSANSSYSFNMVPGESFLDINRVEFRFNPPDRIGGIFSTKDQTSLIDDEEYNLSNNENTENKLEEEMGNQSNSLVKTHTPFTVPLDLPQDNPYGRTYTTSSIRITAYSNINSNGIGLGSVNRQRIGIISNVPQGLVASTIVFFNRLDLKANISRTVAPAGNRTVTLSLRDVHVSLPTRCRIALLPNVSREYLLGFRYSSLFRDVIANPSNLSVLNDIFQIGINGDSVIITDLSNTNIYTNIIKNFELPDNVFIQDTCSL